MTTTNFPGSGADYPISDPPQGSSSTTEQAGQAAETAKNEGRHVAGVAQDEAKKVASEARDQAYDLVQQASSQVEEQSRTQKDRLAQTARTFGEDLDSMASQGEGLAATVARQVADQVKAFSSQLESHEPTELLDEVRSFARRRPGTFLLSALAAGVVAGRLTRGAKEARADGDSTTTGTGSTYGAPTYAADVTSPAAPLSSGYDAPSSGPIDPVPDAAGTASGDPLAGTGTPVDPVLPSDPQVETDTDPATTWVDPSQQGGRP